MLHSHSLSPETDEYLQAITRHINRCFIEISRNNIQEILGSKVNDKQVQESILSNLFQSSFYSPIHRSHSLTHHHIYRTKDKSRMSKLPGPMALIPLPDELKLYLASPIHGEALGWEIPDMIPSKDYKLESYDWDSLICLNL